MNSSILEATLIYPLYLLGSVIMLTFLLTPPKSILKEFPFQIVLTIVTHSY